MDEKALKVLMWEAWDALRASYEPAIDPLITQSGLDQHGWGLLLAALTFEPETTTPAHLMVRVPYTSADEYLMRLSEVAGSGFLEEVSAGKFRLTPAGRTAVEAFIQVAREAMARADPLSPEGGDALASVLERLVHACMETPPPPSTWSIAVSMKLLPEKAPAMPYIEQAFSCLAAYRDDAHLAAWQTSSLSATTLEVLTLLWKKEVSTFDDITHKLVARGHPSQVYVDALDELHSRGFIIRSKDAIRLDDEVRLTNSGRQFRKQIEVDTDRHFFKPWVSLSQAEKEDLRTNLEKMRDGLKSEKK